MATLFLIRHGLTALTGTKLYGQMPGIELDARGRAEAEQLVERFASVRLTAVYSSPLERCVQTLAPLAAANHLEVVTRDELIEMDAGAWTGRTLASLRRAKAWRTVLQAPSQFGFPGGESFTEAQDRVVREIRRIAERHPKGRVAVGTHGDLVRILIAHLGGTHLDHFQRTVVDTASVSVVHLGGGVPRILLVNDTGGLERFAPPPRTSAGVRDPGPGTAGSRSSGRRNLRG